jgi:NADP-dependent 3-hydroxy acid dehydrogenase YdfG
MVLTNVLDPALTIRPTLPNMLERAAAATSSPARSPVAGARPGSLYSATKLAAKTIGEALRRELRQMDDDDKSR